MLYKNINIITGVPADVEACKTAIDNMQLFDYSTKEVISAISAYRQKVYYATHLHEDAGKWILNVDGRKYDNIEAIERAVDLIKLQEQH